LASAGRCSGESDKVDLQYQDAAALNACTPDRPWSISDLLFSAPSIERVLILLEAAIGIEPMNKGFAVLKNVLLQVWSYAELCLFVGSPRFLVRVRWPDFGPVAPGCVTPVTQIQGIPGAARAIVDGVSNTKRQPSD
jgi:hypothetical protein